ncbi:MAG: hypothetical protein ACFE95_22765 [Candidatus Hodarchaeota archaeon]
MNIPIEEAILPAITMIEFDNGEKKKVSIYDIKMDGYLGKMYRQRKVRFFSKDDIKNVEVQSDQLSPEQRRILDELREKGNATASQLGCSIRTLFVLKSAGLIENLERFETDDVIGKERVKVHWKCISKDK